MKSLKKKSHKTAAQGKNKKPQVLVANKMPPAAHNKISKARVLLYIAFVYIFCNHGSTNTSGNNSDNNVQFAAKRAKNNHFFVCDAFTLNMGLLKVGVPQPWEKSKKNLRYVRKAGVRQFISHYHRVKDLKGDELLWGDEIEYGIFHVDKEKKEIRLSLRAKEVRMKNWERCIEVIN